MIVFMILDLVWVALVILAVTTLITAFHRMIHVWKMTGGEAGGWGPVKQPFVLPIPETEEVSEEPDEGDEP
jgi:hypothetical protein